MRRFSKNRKAGVLARWPFCAYCRQPYSLPGRSATVDHVIPLARGGSNAAENLVGCCWACNLAKGCRTAAEWATELAENVRSLQAMLPADASATTGGPPA